MYVQFVPTYCKDKKTSSYRQGTFLPAFSEMSSTDLHHAPGPIIKSVLFSDNTVQRRIDDMADDTEKSLCEILVTGDKGLLRVNKQ